MKSNIYGCIKINGDTKQEYGYEKVILVNNIINDEYIQRVIVAHLLAYYLFDYLGSKNQRNDECYYAEYMNQNYQIEEVANRFKLDILMPKKIFINQYNVAFEAAKEYGYVYRDVFAEMYVSRYFKVSTYIAVKRIIELFK